MSPIGRGVPVIASILNITRIHNAVNAVASMRRVIAHARDYAHRFIHLMWVIAKYLFCYFRRSVFGRKLIDVPLHLSILADMEVEFRGLYCYKLINSFCIYIPVLRYSYIGGLQFLVDVIILMGLDETKKATPFQVSLLRILTPLLKLYTAKQVSLLLL